MGGGVDGLKRYGVLLVGVGGQGILTLGDVMARAAMIRGHEVLVAETHGLSQRGGSLAVHVRIGEVSAPASPPGAVDLLVALEALEAARYAHWLRKGGKAVVNEFTWPPPLSSPPKLEDVLRELASRVQHLYTVDAVSLARRTAGSMVAANVVLLGYAVAVDSELREFIDLEAAREALRQVFEGKTLEANLKALEAGYAAGTASTSGGPRGRPAQLPPRL